MLIFSTYFQSPLGLIHLNSDGKFLTSAYFQDHENLKNQSTTVFKEDLKIFQEAKTFLNDYFQKRNPHFAQDKLKLDDNAFRNAVYAILFETSFGELITYGQIAKRLLSIKHLKNMSPQAIGNAVSHNPISIIIPCHRVIGVDGSLNGYSGGIFRKLELLKHEGHQESEFLL